MNNIYNYQLDIESILNINKGKIVSIYLSFPNSDEWKSKIFTGIIEHSSKDYVILSDPNTGIWYIFFTSYINFIEFKEEINLVNNFI